jgi:hypothetical protein
MHFTSRHPKCRSFQELLYDSVRQSSSQPQRHITELFLSSSTRLLTLLTAFEIFIITGVKTKVHVMDVS